jgi:hypothetical protein
MAATGLSWCILEVADYTKYIVAVKRQNTAKESDQYVDNIGQRSGD